jgi:hypothetical protein
MRLRLNRCSITRSLNSELCLAFDVSSCSPRPALCYRPLLALPAHFHEEGDYAWVPDAAPAIRANLRRSFALAWPGYPTARRVHRFLSGWDASPHVKCHSRRPLGQREKRTLPGPDHAWSGIASMLHSLSPWPGIGILGRFPFPPMRTRPTRGTQLALNTPLH